MFVNGTCLNYNVAVKSSTHTMNYDESRLRSKKSSSAKRHVVRNNYTHLS